MHLESTNGSLFKEATVRLSTISLPALFGSNKFETCLFSGKEFEVLATYSTLLEATAGHQQFAEEFGLK
jgi:hypothetical protein